MAPQQDEQVIIEEDENPEDDNNENVIFGEEDDEEDEVMEVDESMTFTEEEETEEESEAEEEQETETTQDQLLDEGETEEQDVDPKKVESEIKGSIAEKANKLDDFDGNWDPILREIRDENDEIPGDYDLDKMKKLSADIRSKLEDKLQGNNSSQEQSEETESMAEDNSEPGQQEEIYNGSDKKDGEFEQKTVIKSGPVELVILKTTRNGEEVFLSGSPSRSYTDQNDEWQDTELLRPRDWPHVRDCYRKASDRYGISFPFE